MPDPGQGGAGAGQGSGGAAGGGTGQGAGAGAPVAFAVPDSFKEAPYLKGVDSYEKVFTMLDGAQKLIGERPAGIPKADSPKEEWDKFYTAAGRPKTPAEYQFEFDPKQQVNEKYVGAVKELMHKFGLTAIQAKGMQKEFDAMSLGFLAEEQKAQDAAFEKEAGKIFGADRDKILARSKELLNEFAPAVMKDRIAKLSNENLILLAGVLNGIHGKYIKTDGSGGKPGAGGGTGTTPDELRAEARALMGSDAYKNAMHADHDNTRAKVDDLYRRAAGQK